MPGEIINMAMNFVLQVYEVWQLKTSSFTRNGRLIKHRIVFVPQICGIQNCKSVCTLLLIGRGILSIYVSYFPKDFAIWRGNPLPINSFSHGHYRAESTEHCYSLVARIPLLAEPERISTNKSDQPGTFSRLGGAFNLCSGIPCSNI